MAEKDQPALSVFHEVEGDTYRLIIEQLDRTTHVLKRVHTTIEMTTVAAHELADAIEETLRLAGEHERDRTES